MPQKKITRVEFPAKLLSPLQSTLVKRVAAYARVSTVKDAQENSLQSQQEYFTEYIRQHPDWAFAGMYTDDGVSGFNNCFIATSTNFEIFGASTTIRFRTDIPIELFT